MSINFFSSLSHKFKLTPISNVSLVRNLIGSFICILAYSLLFYIILIYPLEGDKASSLASMFGFAATLYAPVGAFFLIDNWKEQTKYNAQLTVLAEMKKNLEQIRLNLYEFQNIKENTLFLETLLAKIESKGKISDHVDDKISKWDLGDFLYPNFNKIYDLIDELSTNKFLLELYSEDFNNIFFKNEYNADNLNRLKHYVKGLDKAFNFFHEKVKDEKIEKYRSSHMKKELLENAIFCSELFHNRKFKHLYPYKLLDRNKLRLNNKIIEINENIYFYRKYMEK